MNKLITLLVIGLSAVFSSLSAQVTFEISPSSTMINNGESVCLAVDVSNFTDMVSMQFSINYDAAVVEFDMAQGLNLAGLSPSNIGNPSPGNITVSWLSDDILNGTTVADGTTIFELCFTGITANGTSPVDFSATPTPIEVTTPNGVVSPNFNNGEIIVGSGGGGGGGSGDLTLSASSANIAVGEQTCLEISVDNFTDAVSMQFSINYDPAVLDYDMAQGLNLAGLSPSNIGNPSPGNITVSWLSDDVINGTTVPDGTVIFELCFTGAANGTSDIDFSGSPTPIEVTTPSGVVSPVFNSGQVVVGSGGGGGGGSNDLTFTASNESVAAGNQTCVEISVDNFTDLVSMQFSINYDPSIVEFDMAQSLNLAGLSASNIGNPSAGNITVSWLSDDVINGTTVADGTVIFELCFTGLSNGTSGIDFSASPTPIEVTDPNGVLTPVFDDGAIQVTGGGGGGTTDLTFTASNESIAAGEQACVEISVDNFDDLVSMQFSINYDPAIVEFDMAQGLNLAGLSASNIGNPSAGNITVSWLSDDVINGTTVADGTVIFELCFTGLSNGTSGIDFSSSPTPVEVTDPNGVLTPVFDDGAIQVTGGGGGGGTTDLTFTASNESIAAGEQACVEISVDNFDDLVSMQFSINYDPAIVEFDMAQNLNLAGLAASNIGNPSAGNITVSWLSDDVINGTTVADGTVIFELCFTGLSNGTSGIDFSASPTPVEVTNPGGIVNPVFDDGAIQVSGGVIDGVLFIASDEFGQNGDQVCVPISVQNFDDLVSMQFSINYDASILQYDMAQGLNLAGLAASNIGNPSAGNVTVSWLSDDVINGTTVADGTVIFELCFTVIGSNGEVSPIDFSGAPTPIEVTDPNGIVNFNNQNGSVTVGAPPPSDGVVINIGSGSGEVGDQVCVDISVEDFIDMVSLQYSINYDPSILQYDGPTGFNLPGLNASNIGNPSAGNVTFSWLSDDVVNGTTVPDDQVIFSLCFDLIGSAGEISDLDFSGSPTPIEGTDPNGTVNVSGNDGEIEIEGLIMVDDFALFLANIDVESGDQFCVPVSTANFTQIVSMQFSINYDPAALQFNDADNLNLAGLTASNIGNPSAGNITVSWLSDDVINGTSVADGTEIFELCFTALAPNCTETDIDFSGTPTPIEVTDPSNVIPTQFFGSTINICEIVIPADPLDLSAGSAVGEPGGQVCIPVTAESGMANITGMEFSFNFDPSVVTFAGIDNENLAGLSIGNFSNPSAGNVTLDWSAPNQGTGVTLADGTLLFELCFNVVGQDGDQSSVDFSGSPLPINISNVANGSNVPFDSSGGLIEVVQTCTAPVISNSQVLNTCPDLTEGSISIEVNGGDDNYSFAWSNNANTQNINNLGQGSYTVTVTSCGLETTANFNVQEFIGPSINNIAPTDVACFGDNSGAIFVNVNANGPNYQWQGTGNINNPTAQNITGLVAGTYSLTVTDANNCEVSSGSIEITEPVAPLNVVLSSTTDVECAGDENGAIDLVVTGGTPGYDYDWTPNLPNIQDPSGLDGGTYSVEVIDDNNCTFLLSPILIDEPDPLTVQVDQVNDETDTANGSVFVTVDGGEAPYNYLWQGPSGPMITQDIINLVAGEYCLTVTDANNCETDVCVDVIKPLEVQLDSIVNTCFQDASGAIYVTVVGGTQPYEYLWEGPGGNTSNMEDLTGLAGGIYILTVEDATGDQISIQVNVFEPSEPLSINDVSIECVSMQGSCDGFIVIENVTGGTPPYSYSWSNGQAGPTANGLCVGTYFVTVEDANGCQTTGSGTVCFTPPEMFITNIPPQDVDCFGAATGSWTVEVDGGLPPYEFNFNDIGVINNNDGSETRFNLPAGMYSCTVTDAFGQVQVASTTINEPPALELLDIAILPQTNPGANGEIDITMNGGTLPYSYQWSNGYAGPDPVNLVENCYTLTVIDNNDCLFFSDPICVPTLEVTNANVTDVFCENDTDGSILVGVGGGLNEPITYTWTGPNGSVSADSNLVENLPPGTYTLVLTDALGVTTQPITIEVGFTSQVDVQAAIAEDVSCPGGTDGALLASASNGEAPYDYEWCNGLGFDALLMNVGVGSYCVIVTDAFGCTDTTEVVLDGPQAFVGQTESETDDACSEQATGELFVNFSGGTAPYMYEWDDPQNQTTNPAIRLEGGTYTVTITDANGCTFTESYDVFGAEPLDVIFNVEPDNGNGDGIATVVVTGGTQPYSYDWNIETPDNNSSMITQLTAGEYNVVVTDADGCVVMGSVVVPDGRIECLEYRNVITPDGDGMNETFLIQCVEMYESHNLEIYNRWGQLVYESAAYANDWAGFNNKGTEVADGAYFFIFEYEDREGQRRQLKGHITLIR